MGSNIMKIWWDCPFIILYQDLHVTLSSGSTLKFCYTFSFPRFFFSFEHHFHFCNFFHIIRTELFVQTRVYSFNTGIAWQLAGIFLTAGPIGMPVSDSWILLYGYLMKNRECNRFYKCKTTNKSVLFVQCNVYRVIANPDPYFFLGSGRFFFFLSTRMHNTGRFDFFLCILDKGNPFITLL